MNDKLLFVPIIHGCIVEIQIFFNGKQRGVMTLTQAEWNMIRPMLVWANSWYLRKEATIKVQSEVEPEKGMIVNDKEKRGA
jgi:hypothetical protein